MSPEKGQARCQHGAANAPRYVLALTFLQRLRGFLGRRRGWLAPGQVLVIAPCRSIHTFGMREALDVAFVDESGAVLISVRGCPPRRLLRCPKARMAIERFAASAEIPWYETGDEVDVAVL